LVIKLFIKSDVLTEALRH